MNIVNELASADPLIRAKAIATLISTTEGQREILDQFLDSHREAKDDLGDQAFILRQSDDPEDEAKHEAMLETIDRMRNTVHELIKSAPILVSSCLGARLDAIVDLLPNHIEIGVPIEKLDADLVSVLRFAEEQKYRSARFPGENASKGLVGELTLHVAAIDDLIANYSKEDNELLGSKGTKATKADLKQDLAKLKEQRIYWSGVLDVARK